MTVIRYWTMRAHPGRFDDGVAVLREGSKLIERHGGHEVRVSRGIMAGENSDSLVLSCEFDDHAALGAFVDEFGRDAEYDSYIHRLRAADAPLLLVSSSLASEVTLERANPKTDRGTVIDAFVTRPMPGRLTDALRLSATAFDLFDRFGAARCRLWQLGTGGTQAGTHASIVEFDSMTTWGRARDAFLSDTESRAIIDTVNGPESPTERIAHSVYTAIDL